MKQLLVYGFAVLLFCSCNQRTGSGNIITEKRQTGDFTGVSVGGAFTVELKIGPVTEVEVEADDNVMKYIETRVSGNTLKIGTKNSHGFNNAHFKVYVTAPEIKMIRSSGAASVKASGILKTTDKIRLDVSGAAHITASVDAPEVNAEVSGAGNIDLDGRTRNYTAEVSGSGNLKSANLQSENTDVSVSGAGTARVHASVSLKAHANGAGNIYYKGGASVQQRTSGAGNVRKED